MYCLTNTYWRCACYILFTNTCIETLINIKYYTPSQLTLSLTYHVLPDCLHELCHVRFLAIRVRSKQIGAENFWWKYSPSVSVSKCAARKHQECWRLRRAGRLLQAAARSAFLDQRQLAQASSSILQLYRKTTAFVSLYWMAIMNDFRSVSCNGGLTLWGLISQATVPWQTNWCLEQLGYPKEPIRILSKTDAQLRLALNRW